MLRDSYSDVKNGRKSMKPIIVIVMCLLVCSPAFGRQHKHSLRTMKELRALTASETDGGDGTSTSETDDNDEKNDTEDSDTDATTDTEDQDTSDTKHNDDNETDDSDDDANTVKTAILNSLRASAKQNSKVPLAAVAAALNAELDSKQTIAKLLQPSDSAVATAALAGQSPIGSFGAVAGTTFTSASGATEATGGSLAAGTLLSADVPEPAASLLMSMAALSFFWRRKRH
jgi:hypothetical protein